MMALDSDEIIDLTGHEENDDDAESAQDLDIYDRRALLFPIVTRVVDALGGHEAGEYRLGDEALHCLKDLKKLWRKDDDDDERTVARIFYETRVLPNDLIPILMLTAGKGSVEDKHAIACADLMTAMTWPIDMAEELKELDDELDKGTDYTQLLRSHLEYKAALLEPGVMQALFSIMLPPLSKAPRERTQRDGQIVNLVLHLIRNLAFIRDLHLNADKSTDSAEFSTLQNRLVLALHGTHALRLLLTVAANVDRDKLFENWNTLVLEIVFLLLRGVNPTELAMDQAKQPGANLQRLLQVEAQKRRGTTRNATSRHSRFGTTIAITLNPKKKTSTEGGGVDGPPSSSLPSRPLVLHHQQAVNNSAGALLDMGKKQKGRKGLTVDELTRDDNLSLEARRVLQRWACDFLGECFNSFVSTLIKDIRSERPKITEKDHLRLLCVSKWFLEFFLALRTKPNADASSWGFPLVAQVTEREWIGWAFKRMREAVEEKPKLWTELQAGIDCLTQLLLLLDSMASSALTPESVGNDDEEDGVDLPEQAVVLQQQLIYNGEILDLALESLRAYRPGTQSLKYLDVSIGFAWALVRMVERMNKRNASGVAALVRQKKIRKRKKKSKEGPQNKDAVEGTAEANKASNENVGSIKGADYEEEDEEDGNESEIEIRETMFTFEAFEMKLANAEITQTLLTYLERYKEFGSPECMRRVVSLLHRQAVRAKAEGLFFNVSTLGLFQTILADYKSFPRQQAYKDLIALINFILRQFFRALEKDSFLAIEAFFPKNRGNWKQYSSWEPETKPRRRDGSKETDDISGKNGVGGGDNLLPEVRVKRGYSWSDQLGIAIAALTEARQESLIQWTKEILSLVIAQRQRIIEETDGENEAQEAISDNENEVMAIQNTPSAEALAQLTDYSIPYVNDEQAHAANRNPLLKLLFKLCKFSVRDDDADELEWYIPATVLVSDLRSMLIVINQFIDSPFDLDGKKASQLLSKPTRRTRRAKRRSLSSDDDEAVVSEGVSQKKREKKIKEKKDYKSAQFIEDSDAEYGDIEAFLEKEKVLREKAIAAAAKAGVVDRPVGMKSSGTKKRRRRNGDEGKGGKRRRKGKPSSQQKGDAASDPSSTNSDLDKDSDSELDSLSGVEEETPSSRPKPRPLAPSRASAPSSGAVSAESSPRSEMGEALSRRRVKALVLSDDEDE